MLACLRGIELNVGLSLVTRMTTQIGTRVGTKLEYDQFNNCQSQKLARPHLQFSNVSLTTVCQGPTAGSAALERVGKSPRQGQEE